MCGRVGGGGTATSYPTNRRAGGGSLYRRSEREIRLLPLSGIELLSLGRPARSLHIMLTTLPRLLMIIERWWLLGHELSTNILNDKRVGYNEHYKIIFAHFYFWFYFLTLQCKYKQNTNTIKISMQNKIKIWIGCFNDATGSTAGTRLTGQRILYKYKDTDARQLCKKLLVFEDRMNN